MANIYEITNSISALWHTRKRHNELCDIRQELRDKRLKAEEGLEHLRNDYHEIKEHLEDILNHDEIHMMKKYI